MLYAGLAVVIELAGGPRYRSALLLGQYLVLLPCAAVVMRAHDGDGRTRDIEPGTLIAVGVVIAAVVLAIASFWDRGILWGDETAYRLQAQIFALGKPWIDAPTGPSAEELRFTHLIVHDGHWFTKYPPLWPVVLALGGLLHVRWLVNPVLAVVALWIIHRIARRELGLPNARFAVLIVLVSPFFFMMAASQMSHMLGLVCCSGAALAFIAELLGEVAAAAAPFRLGVIEREVGILEQIFGVRRIVRIDRNADRGARDERFLPHLDRTIQQPPQLLPDQPRLQRVVDLAQNDELIAAQPRDHRVGRHLEFQLLRNDAQNLVADHVAVNVIDVLEVVEIDPEHRE
jgi:hypothetical protein